jgi:hypothetical protein
MSNRTRIKISRDEAIVLLDNDQRLFHDLTKNVFCSHCQGSIGNKVTEIVNFKIFLENSNDIVLKGQCKACNGPVGRFIETGEDPEIDGKIIKILEKRKE